MNPLYITRCIGQSQSVDCRLTGCYCRVARDDGDIWMLNLNYQKLNLDCSSQLSVVSPDPAGLHDQQDMWVLNQLDMTDNWYMYITVTGIMDTAQEIANNIIMSFSVFTLYCILYQHWLQVSCSLGLYLVALICTYSPVLTIDKFLLLHFEWLYGISVRPH